MFGFSEFISGFFLLSIVYTTTGIRFKFRMAVARLPLFSKAVSFLIIAIGFLTLCIDLFPTGYQFSIQFFLGFLFLLLTSYVYYVYVCPSKFSENNSEKYAKELFNIISKGSDSELRIIGHELATAAASLIRFCREIPITKEVKKNNKNRSEIASDYAHDILLLIPNKKLCKHIVDSSPITARAFFEAMQDQKKYNIPINLFAREITTQALINKNSMLYHENGSFQSDLIGHFKPFSQSMYGNYQLVETLSSSRSGSFKYGPLDIDQLVRSWDALQLKAYCEITKLTLGNYLNNHRKEHSYALYRAFENIKNSCDDVYKLDTIQEYYATDIYKRLEIVVEFFCDTINLIQSVDLKTELSEQSSLYKHIAEIMFYIIYSASWVHSDFNVCWSIHYVVVWNRFFSRFESQKNSWKIIHSKLRCLLYDEIKSLEKERNDRASKILGFCLNVMGLEISSRLEEDFGIEHKSFQKNILAWTAQNYMRLKKTSPDLAGSCLIGGIIFDEKTSCLARTSLDPKQKEHLQLLE